MGSRTDGTVLRTQVPNNTRQDASAATGLEWRSLGGRFITTERDLPEEIAVAIAIGKKPAAVVIASPADYEDLGWGFILTEGIAGRSDIDACTVVQEGSGVRVMLKLTGTARPMRERVLPGRSSCGLCGIKDLDQAIRVVPQVAEGGFLAPEALHAAIAALDQHQPLNARTHAVHAAAHMSPDGRITEVREDVGRHNALDKLVGALARSGVDPAEGAVLLTSRASYEMVDKAAMAGVRILAAISAPSALALRKAQAAGMTLVGVARRDSFVIFCGGERLGRRPA
ncbi:MAG TPA: formate dehydrogenase accessory sulfurtransferase FdhD [Rhizomicrobium sp.]|nr:formate dehydrogenase accessory sulfurtransferase FdhD [Rhizomicrobium sp.]